MCDEIIHVSHQKLFYYKGDYEDFKRMEKQKMAEMMKVATLPSLTHVYSSLLYAILCQAWENQQKTLKRLKASGKVRNDVYQCVIRVVR